MTSEQKIQNALKWWSYRQSLKFFLEAEEIRDNLLQEYFSIRRSFDLLAIDALNLSHTEIKSYIQKCDNFHYSLVQLSERLCPASIQDSLPLSMAYLVEKWQSSHPLVSISFDMPLTWSNESKERSLIVLMAVEELMQITLPEGMLAISMILNLETDATLDKINIKISYPDRSTLSFYANLPDLEYLSESFQFLMSGKCFWSSEDLSLFWSFCW
ncbi:hypothetical protein B6N60_04347 [Richelia sinica FACHB-800]|uniref:Uncharacterized protein n=1 Tax=Richelia sinica FACHB-800 TaxID=1357546 RepID=A0A975TBF0_9NOST|nr:hypothetical protein [Richelia sinica]MBD2665504.1 hypothetical protein [Richelia sinica FACHB-800]QXE25627.1 hypothetical protein B6N60_04347 [Richelia sinica FACHB-800]